MALRRLSLPIIFALILLSSQVLLARELEEQPAAEEKKDKLNVKGANVKADDAKLNVHGHGSEEDDDTEVDGFDDDKQRFGYGYGRGYGYGYGGRYGYGRGYRYGRGYGGGYGYGRGFGGRRCRFFCGFRCCSAEEYAEFVQAGN